MKWRTAIVYLLALTSAQAVILYRTGDVTENTTAPDVVFPHDGWDYEGDYNGFLGTPIAPSFFISAKHVSGGTAASIVFQGVTYTVIREYRDPASDLDIFQINAVFPFYATLYARQDETGQRIVDIGRGTQRGSAIYYNNDPAQLRGWSHAAGTEGTRRWGENVVSGAVINSPDWELLISDFDQNGLPNECHLSSGDSGGAAFINDGGIWKLAGINYAIDDGFYKAPNAATAFNGAIFDLRGFYYVSGGMFVQVPLDSPAPVPTAFYPTRISTKLPWIYSAIDPAGDYDGDGIPNLLSYARRLNATPGTWSPPGLAVANGVASFTYRKLSDAVQLQYRIEESFDLVSWMPASATSETVTATNENVQTIEAHIPVSTGPAFFRLRITQ